MQRRMNQQDAVFRCPSCEVQVEAALPPFGAFLDGWPYCCALPMLLVAAVNSWEWSGAKTSDQGAQRLRGRPLKGPFSS
jgi:hypothetical protein